MIEFVPERIRRLYRSGAHVERFELDLPRLCETRPRREHREALSALYKPKGRVEAAQRDAPVAGDTE